MSIAIGALIGGLILFFAFAYRRGTDPETRRYFKCLPVLYAMGPSVVSENGWGDYSGEVSCQGPVVEIDGKYALMYINYYEDLFGLVFTDRTFQKISARKIVNIDANISDNHNLVNDIRVYFDLVDGRRVTAKFLHSPASNKSERVKRLLNDAITFDKMLRSLVTGQTVM